MGGHAGEDAGSAGHVEHPRTTNDDERVEGPLCEAPAEDGVEVLRVDRRRRLIVRDTRSQERRVASAPDGDDERRVSFGRDGKADS